MSSPYSYTGTFAVDTGQLLAEITAAGLPAPTDLQGTYGGIGTLATAVRVFFAPDLTAGQVTTLNGVIAAHVSGTAAAYVTKLARQAADTLISAPDAPWKLVRAVLLVALSEINTLRERNASQDAAVAAATSLADLKSRWATVASGSPMADRTFAQLKNAVQNQIDTGSAD